MTEKSTAVKLVNARFAFMPDDIAALKERFDYLEGKIFAEFEERILGEDGKPDLSKLAAIYGSPGFMTIDEHMETYRTILENGADLANGSGNGRSAMHMVLLDGGRVFCITGNNKLSDLRAEYLAMLLQHRLFERFFEKNPQVIPQEAPAAEPAA